MSSLSFSIASLPELVRDSQLPARFETDGEQHAIIHVRSSSLRSIQERWISQRKLGAGGQGSVDLQVAQGRQSRMRAVKTLHLPEKLTPSGQKLYERELETICKFSQAKYSDHFVKSFGWFTSPACIHITMEYCELGDLENYLKKCINHRLPEAETHDISRQILDALNSMHTEEYSHRDLKLANILIVSTSPCWWVKLADFGLSKRGSGFGQTTTVKGTVNYMPPELFGHGGNTKEVDYYAVDMWCLGQVVFRLVTGQAMFASIADLSKYYFGQLPFPEHLLRRHEDIDKNLLTFVSSLAAPEPTKRLSSKGALAHPWIMSRKQYTHVTSVPKDAGIPTVLNTFQGDVSEASAAWPTEEPATPTSQESADGGVSTTGFTEETAIPAYQKPCDQEEAPTSLPSDILDAPSMEDSAENFKHAGNRFFKEGKYTEAIEQYTQAINLVPLSSSYLGNRAAAYISMEDYEAALKDCLDALDIDSNNFKLLMRLSRIYLYTGRIEDAKLVLSRAEPTPAGERPSNEIDILTRLERAQWIIKDGYYIDQAFAALTEAEDLLSSSVRVPRKWKLMRAEIHLQVASEESLYEATRIIKSLLELNNQDSEALFLLSRVQFAAGDIEGAVQYDQDAILYNPSLQQDTQWRRLLKKVARLKKRGDNFLKDSRPLDAVRAYSSAIALYPDSKEVQALLCRKRAQCYIDLGDYSLAISDCDYAIRICPNNIKAIITMGDAAYQSGDFKKAIRAWEQAQKMDPEDERISQDIDIARIALEKERYYKDSRMKIQTSRPRGAYQDKAGDERPASRPTKPQSFVNDYRRESTRDPNKPGNSSEPSGHFQFGNAEDIFEEFMRMNRRDDSEILDRPSNATKPSGQLQFGNAEDIFEEFMRMNRDDSENATEPSGQSQSGNSQDIFKEFRRRNRDN